MAKEFDIYLNKRLTECDILVYSIPYRDGLTAIHKLVLESCIESYMQPSLILRRHFKHTTPYILTLQELKYLQSA